MKPAPDQKLPDENEIENLLEGFKPKPTQRYYQRMQSAPWLNTDQYKRMSSRRIQQRLIWGLVVLLIAVFVGVTLFVPSINAIARQIIFSFLPAPSDRIEVQVTPSSQGDLFNYNDPSNFPLTIAEAEQVSGFAVKQIYPLPNNLLFSGARYEASYNAVILLYPGDNYVLVLTQRPVNNSQDTFSIGQGAEVKLVKIGDIQGELVVGGWKAISTQIVPIDQATENPVSITAVWDNTLPQVTLRWHSSQMAYELRTVGENSPSQNDLIMWANELK